MTERGNITRGQAAELVRLGKSSGSNLRVQQMVVANAASYGDYIACRTWDGTSIGAATILVARPYKLRRTPFHGQTRHGIAYDYSTVNRRTATRASDGKVETQVVTPAYRALDSDAADTIYAVTGIAGGTGVFDAENPDQAVVWLDLNVDGRAWAKESA